MEGSYSTKTQEANKSCFIQNVSLSNPLTSDLLFQFAWSMGWTGCSFYLQSYLIRQCVPLKKEINHLFFENLFETRSCVPKVTVVISVHSLCTMALTVMNLLFAFLAPVHRLSAGG